MKLDLHMHTTFSDGTLPPEKVVSLAVEGGLDVIAITDHDNTEGVGPALRAAGERIPVHPRRGDERPLARRIDPRPWIFRGPRRASDDRPLPEPA